jgi:cytosine/adenosine deaminase-related metal-dependent hydrolase/ubiquinone/menaquinone biosynthesis C-methylase UbiE
MGQRIHQSSQTKARKSVTATAFSSFDVFDTWAQVYDEQPNPLLMLEQRFLSQMLPDINGLDVLDAGCGTGRWLQLLAPRGSASLIGVDSSTKMLHRAAEKIGTACSLRLGTCTALPTADGVIDLVLSSFVLSYLESLKDFARELHRVTRPGANVFLTDMHPDTAITCNWTRSFTHDGSTERLRVSGHSLQTIIDTFKACGFVLLANIQPTFDLDERKIFEENGKLSFYEESANLPAVYILQFQKRSLVSKLSDAKESSQALHLSGARYALGPRAATEGSIEIERGHIHSLLAKSPIKGETRAGLWETIDLSGYILLPGLINAHDHLEFSLFPNLGVGPYLNSTEWAREIHRTHAATIACHRKVPKQTRLRWGAVRNLLCGVTTVCHHNPLTRELVAADFPVRVLARFGWAHSLAMDPNLLHNFDHTPPNLPFVVHAAEGVDAKSAQEIFDLDRLEILDERTVLVHGLALNHKAVSLLNQRRSALVICPTSNQFLFHSALSATLIKSIHTVVLGSDSPLTSAGDLLDEIRFTRNHIGLDADSLFEMVTVRSASVLRLRNGEGRLRPGSVADLIAVRDKGLTPAETVAQLTVDQVELVILGGRVQLASDSLYACLPNSLQAGLQPLFVEGTKRWLRAPIDSLLAQARKTLGRDLKVGGKKVEHASAA